MYAAKLRVTESLLFLAGDLILDEMQRLVGNGCVPLLSAAVSLLASDLPLFLCQLCDLSVGENHLSLSIDTTDGVNLMGL